MAPTETAIMKATATGETSPTKTPTAVESATAKSSWVETTTATAETSSVETATASAVAASAPAVGNCRSCGSQGDRNDAC
jgi:hypothetical protein